MLIIYYIKRCILDDEKRELSGENSNHPLRMHATEDGKKALIPETALSSVVGGSADLLSDKVADLLVASGQSGLSSSGNLSMAFNFRPIYGSASPKFVQTVSRVNSFGYLKLHSNLYSLNIRL